MVVNKLINHPENLIEELIEGIVSAHPRILDVAGKTGRAIIAKNGPRKGKVGVVIGGGSGHEPAFACYVGRGLADAAPVGNIFASPSPAHIVDAALAAERGAGVVFLYGNYAGDVMNFDMAADQLSDMGLEASSFLVTDDVASALPEKANERRGIAGGFFVFKIAGAAADMNLPHAEVLLAARKANNNTRTMGVALSACSMPQTGKANFHIPDGRMEVGMGIHGEPGIEQVPIETADEVTNRLLDPILQELKLGEGDKVAVLVNGLGSTTLLEQYLIHKRVASTLNTRKIEIHNSWVGEYCTSLEMAGVSITLIKLDDALTRWLDHPCETPALTVGTLQQLPHAQLEQEQHAVELGAVGFVQDKSNLSTEGSLTPSMFRNALSQIGVQIISAKEELCELDGVIGDGDHGVTMEIGWNAIAVALEKLPDDATISEMSFACADAFLNSVGASAGPLYATGFKSAAHAVSDRLNLDAHATAKWISGLANGVQERGKANLEDKTMVDVWIPAADAAHEAAQNGAAVQEVLAVAARVGRERAKYTAQLISKKGRSKVLGKRSLGHVDPGAQSAALFLDALAHSMK